MMEKLQAKATSSLRSEDSPPAATDVEAVGSEKEEKEPKEEVIIKYPPSCYSLLAKGKGFAFAFGLFVIILQNTLLGFMFWFSQTLFAREVERDATTRITQFLALIGFFLASQYCIGEANGAILVCPFTAEQRARNKQLLFACVIRMIACLIAVIVTTTLILNRTSPPQIILAITIVETVTKFDASSFAKANAGTFGSRLKMATDEILEQAIPDYAQGSTDTVRFRKILFQAFQSTILLAMVILWGVTFGSKGTITVITTKPFQSFTVTFPKSGSGNLVWFEGCYNLTPSANQTDYPVYVHELSDFANTSISYCDTEGRFTISANSSDPCESIVLRSIKTPYERSVGAFQSISNEKPWYTPADEPFDYTFLLAELSYDPCNETTEEELLLTVGVKVINATTEKEPTNITFDNEP